jgi:hypothetical protein
MGMSGMRKTWEGYTPSSLWTCLGIPITVLLLRLLCFAFSGFLPEFKGLKEDPAQRNTKSTFRVDAIKCPNFKSSVPVHCDKRV